MRSSKFLKKIVVIVALAALIMTVFAPAFF